MIARLHDVRLIPAIERSPRLVALAQTAPGKAALVVLFTALLAVRHTEYWLATGLALLATSFVPQHRRAIVSAAAVLALGRRSWFRWNIVVACADRLGVPALGRESYLYWATVVLAVAFCAAFVELARRSRKLPVLRRPVASLLLFYLLSLSIASYAPLAASGRLWLWAFLVVVGKFLWFLAYSLSDRDPKERQPFWLQFGHYIPPWGSTYTPFPKGGASLRKIEVKDAVGLAVSQLKGMKLLVWALMLQVARRLCEHFLYGASGGHGALGWVPGLHLPTLEDALMAHAHGTPYALGARWGAVLANFVEKLLELTIWGHVIIAGCRVAGFQALRNTYKPLLSTSVAEWWNRVFYYFKELLVEFFFYPAYMTFFKGHPRLRVAFATMAAAGFGNVVFHYLRDVSVIIETGLLASMWSFRVYVVYALILGVSITVSQLRTKSRQKKGIVPRYNLLSALFTASFYCLLGIIDEPIRTLTLGDYGRFALGLAGL